MRTIALLLAFIIYSACLWAQDVHIGFSGGVNANAFDSKDILSRRGVGNPALELTALVDNKHWQVGASARVFSIRRDCTYLFERSRLPDSMAHDYITDIAVPSFMPYLFANYKYHLGKAGLYLFGGLNAGYWLPVTGNRMPYYSSVQSQPAFTYGLQGGVSTKTTGIFTVGVLLTSNWLKTTGRLQYTNNTTLYDVNKNPIYLTTNIDYTAHYALHLYSVQVFLRVRLNNNQPPTPKPSDISENE